MTKKTLIEENPPYMLEWDYIKNNPLGLDPSLLSRGSTKKVWWKCSKCGYEWLTAIYNRSAGTGCPRCGRQRSHKARITPKRGESFGEKYPNIAKEWSAKNIDISNPYKVKAHCRMRVLWKCAKCGYEWETTFDKRANGNGCPVCAGRVVVEGINDLKTLRPQIAKEWDTEKNGLLKPKDVTVQSARCVYWKCAKCGHIWKTAIYNRTIGYGCPKCGTARMAKSHEIPKINESLAEVNPQLAKEWNYEKNGDLTPGLVKAHSGKRVWWKCTHGHEWQATINSRSGKHSKCPVCSIEKQTSYPEQAIFYYLSKYYKEIHNRYRFTDGKNRYEVDIYIPSMQIGIEYDGIYWHTGKQAIERKKEDFLHKIGIYLIRIKEGEHNCLIDNKIIFYKITAGFKYTNLPWAIYKLYNLLGVSSYKTIDLERDSLKIIDKYKKTFYEKSFASQYPEIAKEWDYEKNENLKPEEFSPKSNAVVWWKCSKGHSWKTDINHRASGRGCPYCAGKRVLKGFNDLASQFPLLMTEWNYEKNQEINPSEVTAHSTKVVGWKCSQCGGEWLAPIARRTSGYHSGCPYCAGKKVLKGVNDLASQFPQLIAEWDFSQNNKKIFFRTQF